MRRWSNVVLMLVHRLRRCPTLKQHCVNACVGAGIGSGRPRVVVVVYVGIRTPAGSSELGLPRDPFNITHPLSCNKQIKATSNILVGLPYGQSLLHLAFWKPQSFFCCFDMLR